MKRFRLLFIVFGLAGFSNAGRGFDSVEILIIQAETSFIPRDSFDFIDQDRIEVGFNNMMTELTRVHKAVYSLPFEYDYIKNTLMVEVEAKKLEIAPHFPNRSSYGDNTALGHQLFKEWYLTYPSECSAYIAFLDQFILAHSN